MSGSRVDVKFVVGSVVGCGLSGLIVSGTFVFLEGSDKLLLPMLVSFSSCFVRIMISCGSLNLV